MYSRSSRPVRFGAVPGGDGAAGRERHLARRRHQPITRPRAASWTVFVRRQPVPHRRPRCRRDQQEPPLEIELPDGAGDGTSSGWCGNGCAPASIRKSSTSSTSAQWCIRREVKPAPRTSRKAAGRSAHDADRARLRHGRDPRRRRAQQAGVDPDRRRSRCPGSCSIRRGRARMMSGPRASGRECSENGSNHGAFPRFAPFRSECEMNRRRDFAEAI